MIITGLSIFGGDALGDIGLIRALSSICIMFLFIFLWGKFRIVLAKQKFEKAKKLIEINDYIGAIKILENIGDDFKYDPEYWYGLAFALVGVNDIEDALPVLDHVFQLKSDHIEANKLREFILCR
jgi:tetratricopeptide (TPR) repeat protein